MAARPPGRVRWGIAGTGAMAATMVRTLRTVDDARLVAVGSRDTDRASAFGRAAGAARSHASYAALVDDPEVDVVYVATPESTHVEVACAALTAGKHVLVEKPFATDAAGARRIVDTARGAARFCMEAMWIRFLPATDLLLRDLDDLDPRLLVASVGFAQAHPADDLLLDLAVYPVSLAHLVLGAPTDVLAGSLSNGAATLTLAHRGGAVSLLSASSSVGLENRLVLAGPSGRRELTELLRADRVADLRGRVTPPMTVTVEPVGLGHQVRSSRLGRRAARQAGRVLRRASGAVRTHRAPVDGDGYAHEVHAVHRALHEGRLECERMPLADSVAVLETIDAARRLAQ